jgi:hypothetical protein
MSAQLSMRLPPGPPSRSDPVSGATPSAARGPEDGWGSMGAAADRAMVAYLLGPYLRTASSGPWEPGRPSPSWGDGGEELHR